MLKRAIATSVFAVTLPLSAASVYASKNVADVMAEQSLASQSDSLIGADASEHAKSNRFTAEKQIADYYHILFVYLQNDYVTALGLIDKGREAHDFSALSQDDVDRLTLMQGASQLYLGLYDKAQGIFLHLLDSASSDYVIAQTWYWLAKSGFENKQPFKSEQAYQAIQSKDLSDHLSFAQWQELTYLAAHSRMQNGAEWQPLFAELHKSTIFPAYLQANYAVELFNKSQFDEAETSFVNAKQALITHQNAQNSTIKMAREFTLDFMHYLSPWNWFSTDPNRLAQQTQENEARQAMEREQNALFDQINLFLGYALIQQSDDMNAQEVIKQVSGEDIHAKDALLTLGWAYAREDKWTDAMNTWQYLSENDVGHFQLQASYAQAYAFQQQGELEQAFFALDRTVNQIASSIDVLQRFSVTIKQAEFLDSYDETWPLQLYDIKRLFLAGNSEVKQIDTNYFLSVRRQSKEILDNLNAKTQQLAVLRSMLEQRESSFLQRGQSLALSAPEEQLIQAKHQIDALRDRLKSNTQEERQALMLQMLIEKEADDWSRLQGALLRHERLLKDPPRGRPLKASYAERLVRIKGVMQWQMEDAFIKESWRHKRLLVDAEKAYDQAMNGLASVRIAQARSPELERDRLRIDSLEQEIAAQTTKASRVFDQADNLLITYLSSIIESRKTELEKQWVNARLAKIRLQDMQPAQEPTQEIKTHENADAQMASQITDQIASTGEIGAQPDLVSSSQAGGGL